MNTPIIEAKLRPVTNGHLLHRERLVDQLSDKASRRLFLVEAHAGSGKTTLAVQFLRSRSLESIWYNLDPQDQDPALFFDYLTMALRSAYPGFCQGLERGSFAMVEGWASFIQELQNSVKQPLFIVLDNFECINGSKGVNQFLAYLIQHMPPTLHLMLLSSQSPRLSLTRYRLSNDLISLKASDLAFTFEEALRLFEEVFETTISRTTVRRILEETEGWALALVLIGQNMDRREVARQIRKRVRPEEYKDEIFEYFLEEVLKSHPRRIQELMISSALLPFLSPKELKGYMGSKNAGVLLKSIQESNMPVFPFNGGTGTYRYHRMFREFLMNKLHEQRSNSDLVHLHRRAATCLRKNHPVEAIEQYLDAREVEQAVVTMEKVGWDLLRQGRYETLKVLLNKIPPDRRSQNHVLLYYAGRIQEIHGDVNGAQRHYQEALKGLGDDAQDARAACKARLGILEYKKDRFRRARTIFASSLSRLEKADIREDIAKRLISAHANLAKVYCKLEEERKTSEHLRRAQSVFDLYGKPEDEVVLLQARTQECLVTGKFPEVVHLGNKGKDLCQKFGFDGVIPVFNYYLAFAQTYMGDFREARILAEKGLSILRAQGVEDCIKGALLAGLGHCHLAEGRVQEGVRALHESTSLFKKTQNFCGQFWNDSTLCLLAARQSDLSEAWDYWRRMERNSRQLALPLQHAMTLIVEAYLSALEQAPDKTMENLSKARKFLMRSHQRMSVFHGLILTVKSYAIIARHDLAEETFLENVSPGEPSKYYYAVHYEGDWFPSFVEQLMQKNPKLRQLWAGAMPSASPSRDLEGGNNGFRIPLHSPACADGQMDLHFYVLGPFRVVANGRDVPLETCPSKKALTLLRYLFFKRHEGGVLLDEALELLWPETDPRVTRSNLRVTLSMLRKVFRRPGNGSKDFPNLIRDGNKLRLSLGKSGWSDVDEFLNQVKLAEYKEKRNLWSEALKHYEKMADLYLGDFLAEELYADWCAMEREYLRDQYITSMMRMVHCHEQMGNLPDAISTLYRVLKMDKYREDAYQKLMVLCASAGRKGEMIRAYTLCKKAIEQDLNMELSKVTTDLYAGLSRLKEDERRPNSAVLLHLVH